MTEGYCWQHKDQAMAGVEPQGLQHSTIRERSSIDTLINRLGIIELDKDPARQRTAHQRQRKPLICSEQAPPNLQSSEIVRQTHRARPKEKHRSAFMCCFGTAEADHIMPRPATRPPRKSSGASGLSPRGAVPASATQQNPQRFPAGTDRVRVPAKSLTADRLEGNKSNNRRHARPVPARAQKSSSRENDCSRNRPAMPRDPPSRTTELLSYIPDTVRPETTAVLLTELAKPVSSLDEAGYIYIFWLTSTSLPTAPPADTASKLLAPPMDLSRPSDGRRRTSDILRTYSTAHEDTSQTTILLKIGRASNVQRRLNEWTRQCGYNISLIRYYPNIPSSGPPSPVSTPRKVPNVHKVERLIHLELAARRATGSGKCGVCQREHREWFEVDASRGGLKEVDDIVKRWVDWGERQSG